MQKIIFSIPDFILQMTFGLKSFKAVLLQCSRTCIADEEVIKIIGFCQSWKTSPMMEHYYRWLMAHPAGFSAYAVVRQMNYFLKNWQLDSSSCCKPPVTDVPHKLAQALCKLFYTFDRLSGSQNCGKLQRSSSNTISLVSKLRTCQNRTQQQSKSKSRREDAKPKFFKHDSKIGNERKPKEVKTAVNYILKRRELIRNQQQQ